MPVILAYAFDAIFKERCPGSQTIQAPPYLCLCGTMGCGPRWCKQALLEVLSCLDDACALMGRVAMPGSLAIYYFGSRLLMPRGLTSSGMRSVNKGVLHGLCNPSARLGLMSKCWPRNGMPPCFKCCFCYLPMIALGWLGLASRGVAALLRSKLDVAG